MAVDALIFIHDLPQKRADALGIFSVSEGKRLMLDLNDHVAASEEVSPQRLVHEYVDEAFVGNVHFLISCKTDDTRIGFYQSVREMSPGENEIQS